MVEPLLDDLDLILLMTVNPGFGGQSFIHSVLPKIAQVRALIGERPISLEIDGGATVETAPLAAKAGADVIVAGSAVFKGGPSAYAGNIAAIRKAAEAARAIGFETSKVRVIPGDRRETRDPFRNGSGMDPGSALRSARDDVEDVMEGRA